MYILGKSTVPQAIKRSTVNHPGQIEGAKVEGRGLLVKVKGALQRSKGARQIKKALEELAETYDVKSVRKVLHSNRENRISDRDMKDIIVANYHGTVRSNGDVGRLILRGSGFKIRLYDRCGTSYYLPISSGNLRKFLDCHLRDTSPDEIIEHVTKGVQSAVEAVRVGKYDLGGRAKSRTQPGQDKL